MPFLEAHYHPFLFAMMMLCGIAELGLTSFLISAGNENGTWPSPRYHALLIMFCFNASWTLLFSSTYMLWYVDGASHFLANIASSVIWILITTILWFRLDRTRRCRPELSPTPHLSYHVKLIYYNLWTFILLFFPSLMSLRIPQQSDRSANYRQVVCDQLLQESNQHDDSDSERYIPAESEGLLGSLSDTDHNFNDSDSIQSSFTTESATSRKRRRRTFLVRAVALMCACSLSIGSHYASNILGPLKSRLQRELGTSHTEFGLMLSAFSLNSTWTPLVGGVLASRLGTTLTSIMATGVILLGQLMLLCGDIWKDVRFMTLGLFIFGLGVSPLAVVQETIIVRFFKSHGLGLSMAFGLIAGKGASFVAARTSYPLTERFGSRAPFYVATSLAAMSVVINLVYIVISKWLVEEAGAELEAPDISQEARERQVTNLTEAQALNKVAEKKKVHFHQISKLGDVFWAYIALNVFCGMIWSPFTHLAANIIENRYSMGEEDASNTASYLLAGPLILYPLCGYLVDTYKHRPIILQLLVLSSILTMSAYTWLALPPSWTQTPIPAIASFALGHGFSPLLLVVIVPRIVPLKYISTTLGAHKSMEQTGSTLFQTLAGLLLDLKQVKKNQAGAQALQYLLHVFLGLNFLQSCMIFLMGYLQYRKELEEKSSSQRISIADEGQPLIDNSSHRRHSSGATQSSTATHGPGVRRRRHEVQRGILFSTVSLALVGTAWILFMFTAWKKLGRHTPQQ
ncbi:hypothetical protein CVT24_011576 [Panaeolus cyanescens]|uniref:Lysosomal dipeptide transporter MFSD1 n=1 Tax=Panaeolus cyanescens TaxID=181874 RepID=A0A409YV39_9AGAR|nr:hypothetical protein CVT24_011576 [Panaeolus cyanescens]